MKKLCRFLRVGVIALAVTFLLIIMAITGFVNVSPQFGDAPTKDEHQRAFATSVNYKDGQFQNQLPTSLQLGFSKTMSVVFDFLFGDSEERDPDGPLPVLKIDPSSVADRASDISRLTWFGHSAILLEIDGTKILLDPMLGQYAGPVALLSPKRYNRELPIEIEKLPFIDAVIISHDHYDHLDYGSIIKLNKKVGRFFVPLGVGSHLRSWGVDPENITELDWWEESRLGKFTFICAPARHFSGRAFTNNMTLWSSWIIQSSNQRFYFSGDSGYGPHFREIGDKYGPFDFVMMECGQYNELWKGIHMMPEETVQATLDVKGKLLLPIHWGAFTLAMHGWTDPVNRVTAVAAKHSLEVATPRIGEPVELDYATVPKFKWWLLVDDALY